MPRRNKRKIYTTGKAAALFSGAADNTGCKPECVGCAFAGYDGVCKASNGTCLLGSGKSDCGEADNAPI